MASLEKHLIRRDDGLALLFTPPFDKTPLDPGYIKGYPPGLRENGGQYSHAAMWAILAFAKLGAGDKAARRCSRCSIRSTMRARRGGRALQGRALCRRRRRLFGLRRMSGAAAGPGTPARRPGCIAPASRAFSASAARAAFLVIDPCIPAAWPGFEATVKLGAARYDIRVENPSHRCRGVSRAVLDGTPISCAEGRVRVPLDTVTHELRISI